MHAQPGDWLVVERADVDHERRTGQITAVRSADGSPPYEVIWADDDHTALVFPGPDARVLTQGELDDENAQRARRYTAVQSRIARSSDGG